MSFEANYPGECQECGSRFPVGALIDRHIDGALIDRHIDGYRHTECPSPRREYTRGDACPKCLLVHAGECW